MLFNVKIAVAFLFSVLLLGCHQSDPIVKESRLVWSDEFDGDALDKSKWEVMLGDGSAYGLWRWGNNEEQYYREENISVQNGKLRIKAIKEEVGDYKYTSARLRSLGNGDFKYGKIEASIRMDVTAGLWHAFWMLPSNPVDVWPKSGEIDIMEYVGNTPEEVLYTVHFANRYGEHDYIGNVDYIAIDGNFHTYAVEWDENKIVWYRDDLETYSVLRTNERLAITWPFDAKFHLLLNVAVGGNLGGQIDDNQLQFPRFMEVDYVRVYQAE